VISALSDNHAAARFIVHDLKANETKCILALLIQIIKNENFQYSYVLVNNAGVTLNDFILEVAQNYQDLRSDFRDYCYNVRLASLISVYCISRLYMPNDKQPNRPAISDRTRMGIIINGIEMLRLLLENVDNNGRMVMEVLKASVQISLCRYITNFITATVLDDDSLKLLDNILALFAAMFRDVQRITSYINAVAEKDKTRSRQEWNKEVVEKPIRFMLTKLYDKDSALLTDGPKTHMRTLAKILRGTIKFLSVLTERYPIFMPLLKELKVHSTLTTLAKVLPKTLSDELRTNIEKVIDHVNTYQN
jgi:hypothetical protein